MKNLLTLEKFTKQYQQKIDVKDFKKIKKGSKILYMGGQVEVLKNDGYVLTLKTKDGKKFTVNKSMFDHGGMIKEGVLDNITLMADASKDYEDFKKKFKKGFPKIFKPTPDFMDWLYGMYKDMAPDKVEEGIVNEKANLKDLAKDLAELDKGKGGQSWITSITVEEDYDNKKGEDIVMISVQGRAGDSTVKAYVNKLLKKLGFKPKFIQRNNKGDIHEYIWHLTQFTPDDVDKIDWKDLEYYRESVNEGIVDDLVKMGAQIDYLYDADPKTQKIWKKAGFDPNDQDNIILYSYVNSWPETKKMLDKKRVKYKELEDPNSAGESYIVFKESLNELNTDGAIMNLWKKLYGEDFVSEYPAVAKILKVNRKNIDRKELARIWDETYGEDLKKEYPDFFKALK